ncbi:MAG: hypothetical protein C4290_05860 [Chloroflexota bacterium]
MKAVLDLNRALIFGDSTLTRVQVGRISCLFNVMTRLTEGLSVEVEDAKARFIAGWLEQRVDPAWAFLRVTAPPA